MIPIGSSLNFLLYLPIIHQADYGEEDGHFDWVATAQTQIRTGNSGTAIRHSQRTLSGQKRLCNRGGGAM